MAWYNIYIPTIPSQTYVLFGPDDVPYFADYMNEHNNGGEFQLLPEGENPGGGSTGESQSWHALQASIQAVQAELAAITSDPNIAQQYKDQVATLLAKLQNLQSQRNAAAFLAALAAARDAVTAAASIARANLIIAVGAIVAMLAMMILVFLGTQMYNIVRNCGLSAAENAFAVAQGLQGLTSGQTPSESQLNALESLLNCANGGGGSGTYTLAQMDGASTAATGSATMFQSNLFSKDGFEEEQTEPCPQCQQDPCICY